MLLQSEKEGSIWRAWEIINDKVTNCNGWKFRKVQRLEFLTQYSTNVYWNLLVKGSVLQKIFINYIP